MELTPAADLLRRTKTVATSSRVRIAVLGLVASASMLAACSEEPGAPAPAAPSTGANSSAAPSASSAVNSPTSNVDPCSLLDAAVLDAQFKNFRPFKDGEVVAGSDGNEQFAGARSCSWKTDRTRAANQRSVLSVTVSVRDSHGLADVQDAGGGVTAGTLGSGRKATQVPYPPSACMFALAVGEGARVDVLVGDHAESCEMVGDVADLVDPKLPKG